MDRIFQKRQTKLGSGGSIPGIRGTDGLVVKTPAYIPSSAATFRAAIIAVALTVTYKLMKFVYTVNHPVILVRR